MQIQLTITLRGRQDDAAGIAQAAAEHLMETFNDDGSLKTAYFKVIHPEDRAAKQDLTRRVAYGYDCPERAQDALATKEPRPSYKDLVAALGTAVAEWAYLFPEKFDDDQHEAQSRKNLKQAELIYKQALKAITKGTGS